MAASTSTGGFPLADRIFFEDLRVRAIIGVNDNERTTRQDVLVGVELWTDIRAAAKSDDFADAVDYRALKKKIMAFVETSSFHLVETLAERIAQLCLDDARIERVRVRVEKPGALRFARTVGVEIERGRDA